MALRPERNRAVACAPEIVVLGAKALNYNPPRRTGSFQSHSQGLQDLQRWRRGDSTHPFWPTGLSPSNRLRGTAIQEESMKMLRGTLFGVLLSLFLVPSGFAGDDAKKENAPSTAKTSAVPLSEPAPAQPAKPSPKTVVMSSALR